MGLKLRRRRKKMKKKKKMILAERGEKTRVKMEKMEGEIEEDGGGGG